MIAGGAGNDDDWVLGGAGCGREGRGGGGTAATAAAAAAVAGTGDGYGGAWRRRHRRRRRDAPRRHRHRRLFRGRRTDDHARVHRGHQCYLGQRQQQQQKQQQQQQHPLTAVLRRARASRSTTRAADSIQRGAFDRRACVRPGRKWNVTITNLENALFLSPSLDRVYRVAMRIMISRLDRLTSPSLCMSKRFAIHSLPK